MKHLRYDIITADLDCGIKVHPQKQMKILGIPYSHSTPQSIGDQWWFWNCDNIPDKMPMYLSDLDIKNPIDYVGFGIDIDEALEISRIQNENLTKL